MPAKLRREMIVQQIRTPLVVASRRMAHRVNSRSATRDEPFVFHTVPPDPEPEPKTV